MESSVPSRLSESEADATDEVFEKFKELLRLAFYVISTTLILAAAVAFALVKVCITTVMHLHASYLESSPSYKCIYDGITSATSRFYRGVCNFIRLASGAWSSVQNLNFLEAYAHLDFAFWNSLPTSAQAAVFPHHRRGIFATLFFVTVIFLMRVLKGGGPLIPLRSGEAPRDGALNRSPPAWPKDREVFSGAAYNSPWQNGLSGGGGGGVPLTAWTFFFAMVAHAIPIVLTATIGFVLRRNRI